MKGKIVSFIFAILFAINCIIKHSIQERTKNEAEKLTHSNKETWEEEQSRRKQNIKKICSNNKFIMSKRTRYHLVYEPRNNLLICLNAKAGVTTWRRLILNLINIKNKGKDIKITRNISDYLREKFSPPKNLTNLGKTTLSFSFVRHPWSRLVSAYFEVRDRIRSFNHGKDSFPDFIELILTKNRYDFNRGYNGNPDSLDQLSGHWCPYYICCSFCNIEYSIIGKVETFSQDAQHISDAGNLNLETDMHLNIKTGKLRKDSNDVTKKYMSQLNMTTVQKLNEFYKYDFEMFLYKPGSWEK